MKALSGRVAKAQFTVHGLHIAYAEVSGLAATSRTGKTTGKQMPDGRLIAVPQQDRDSDDWSYRMSVRAFLPDAPGAA